jgi:hypothetical protein
LEKNVPIGKRIIEHVKRHKVKYIVGGTCLVLGGLFGMYISSNRAKVLIDSVTIDEPVINKIQNNVNIISHIGRNGHPGNVIYCNETKQVFKSHREACRELGIDNRDLWAYIKRLKPTARGFTFTSVGEASNRALNS